MSARETRCTRPLRVKVSRSGTDLGASVSRSISVARPAPSACTTSACSASPTSGSTMTRTDVIPPLTGLVQELHPDIVYCQHGGDVNRDHELLFKAALVATRPTEHCIGAVYAFDTASSTEWAYPRSFVPDTWVDISATLETKIAAMACYESEVRPYPHPRSLDALRNRAKAWGNQTCLEAAEVLLTVRRTRRNGETPA